ncbi:phospholipid scramblase 2-like [Pelobates cultripes]|uniref:Phospholipid scramblase 2-like n=1 Tax=Pelobates cultripes TaxID=61616 RepID=A0AAD1VUU9_PELCU|nr:phospholipid scramblase 2-like [Pelobates cultripes]
MAAPGYPSPMAGYPSPPYPTPPYPGPSAPPAPASPGFHDYPGPGCSIPPHHHMHPSKHPQPDPPGGAPYLPVSTGTATSGLAYLDQIDQILIHQKTELLEGK